MARDISEGEFRRALDRLCVGDIEEWDGQPVQDLSPEVLAGLIRTALYSHRRLADLAMGELERWGCACDRDRRAVACVACAQLLEVSPGPEEPV